MLRTAPQLHPTMTMPNESTSPRTPRWKTTLLLAVLLLALPLPAVGQTRDFDLRRPFGTLQEQAKVQQAWLEDRLEHNLPKVMRSHGVDMWVVTMREYNEDPVFPALVSATTFAARRRTIYMFFDRGPELGVERLALGGTSQGGAYEAIRATSVAEDGQSAELWGMDQWNLFATMVRDRDPKRIAVNISREHSFGDGLTAGEWEQMEEALGDLADRVVREPLVATDYLAMRVPGMTPYYRKLQSIVHEIIATAFSKTVIVPGQTTTEDVVWWMRQRLHDSGLGTWFQPSVEVQRKGVAMGDSVAPVILRGDVLHTDFGITAMGLNTDTQHMGYVLLEGESEAPKGLQVALANANRFQDILLEEIRVGRTGNEILASALKTLRDEGLSGTMYSHPIGDYGHSAGPLIGLWDYQTGVPGRGDVPVVAPMWFSTEMQVTTAIPEWNNQQVRMAVEEEAEVMANGERRWVLRRQTELHLIY